MFARATFARLSRLCTPVPGRAAVVKAVLGDDTAITLAAVYCITGCGAGERNLQVLAAVAEEVEERGLPFVLGGDFQTDREPLESAGWPQALGAKFVGAAEAVGTCISGPAGAKVSNIDFFAVSSGLAASTTSAQACLGA